MTRTQKKKRQFAKDKIAEWQNLLGLAEWKIAPRFYTRLDIQNQFCDFSGSEKIALIGLNPDTQTEEELEHTIAHELSHLVLSPENRIFDNLVDTTIYPRRSRTTHFEQYNLAQNEVIEHYLRLLYPLLGKEYPPHVKVEEDA